MSSPHQQQHGHRPYGPTAYLFEEVYCWHDAGCTQNARKGLQPTTHIESAESKRRMNNLIEYSGAARTLSRVRARLASREELARVHTEDYIDKIRALSADASKGCHRAGDAMSFSPGAYEIAALAAGGAIALVDAVMGGAGAAAASRAAAAARASIKADGGDAGSRGFVAAALNADIGGAAANGAGVSNGSGAAAAAESAAVNGGSSGSAGACGAYGLVRPPGHHAESDQGMGFCVFNNIAVAAAHAMAAHGVERIAVVDFDVHHGNGTQQIFYDDPRVLFLSIHQDGNYPVGSGPMTDTGSGAGDGYTINLPLPPGSGSGAYRAAFDRVVRPALDAYKPELILVSAGFDASALDPLASMMVTAADYRYFGASLRAAADAHCPGKLVALHEGGYSELYVPFCGLAFIEGVSGIDTGVDDPMVSDVAHWGYQEEQPWQAAIIQKCVDGPLARLRAAVAKQAAA